MAATNGKGSCKICQSHPRIVAAIRHDFEKHPKDRLGYRKLSALYGFPVSFIHRHAQRDIYLPQHHARLARLKKK